jgi:hypothetical protein
MNVTLKCSGFHVSGKNVEVLPKATKLLHPDCTALHKSPNSVGVTWRNTNLEEIVALTSPHDGKRKGRENLGNFEVVQD